MNIKIGGIAQMDVHSPKKHVTIGFDPSPDGFTKKNINIRWPTIIDVLTFK